MPAVCGKLAEKRREINHIDSRILRAENGSKRLELAPFAVYRGDYLPLAAPEMRKNRRFYKREQPRLFIFDKYFSHHQRERRRGEYFSPVRRNAQFAVLREHRRMAVGLAREPVVNMIFVDGRMQDNRILVDSRKQRVYALIGALELLRGIVIGQELILLELPAKVVENHALKIRRNSAAERIEQLLIERHGGFEYIIGRKNG